MSNSLRQILPRPSGHVHQDDQPPKKDAKAKAACETCRARKTKCDAKRPECSACASRGSKCEYDIDPDITRYTSLKRRYQDLEQEHTELLDVLDMLRSRSEDDAFSILQRIRTSTDIRATISFIKEGDLLAQARTAAGVTSPTVSSGSGSQSVQGNYQPILPPLRDMLAELHQGQSGADLDQEFRERPLLLPQISRSLQDMHGHFKDSQFKPAAKEWPVEDHNDIVENLTTCLEKMAVSQSSAEDIHFCLLLCAHLLKGISNYFPFVGFILHGLLRQAKEQSNVLLIDALESIFQDMESRHLMFMSIEESRSRYTIDLDIPMLHPKSHSLRMGLWAAYELWSDTKGKEPEAEHPAQLQ